MSCKKCKKVHDQVHDLQYTSAKNLYFSDTIIQDTRNLSPTLQFSKMANVFVYRLCVVAVMLAPCCGYTALLPYVVNILALGKQAMVYVYPTSTVQRQIVRGYVRFRHTRIYTRQTVWHTFGCGNTPCTQHQVRSSTTSLTVTRNGVLPIPKGAWARFNLVTTNITSIKHIPLSYDLPHPLGVHMTEVMVDLNYAPIGLPSCNYFLGPPAGTFDLNLTSSSVLLGDTTLKASCIEADTLRITNWRGYCVRAFYPHARRIEVTGNRSVDLWCVCSRCACFCIFSTR